VPNITPFTSRGEIDEEALRACVRFWVKGGAYGLVPCGSSGEAPYLSRQERNKVIGIVLDEVNGKVPVVAGTGSVSTRETIVFTRDAKDLGVDAALVVTPFYFKLSDREVREHYRTLLEAVDLPYPSIIIHKVSAEDCAGAVHINYVADAPVRMSRRGYNGDGCRPPFNHIPIRIGVIDRHRLSQS